MNGFQPITYGASTKTDNTEVLQKLNNIQTYSGLILNNMGIKVDTGIVLPEFIYNGQVTQAGYGANYGVEIMHVFRNYDFPLGIEMDEVTYNHYIEVVYKYAGVNYTAFLKYTRLSATIEFFKAEPSFYNPIQVNICNHARFTPSYIKDEGKCSIRFYLNTRNTPRAPISVLYISEPKLQFEE